MKRFSAIMISLFPLLLFSCKTKYSVPSLPSVPWTGTPTSTAVPCGYPGNTCTYSPTSTTTPTATPTTSPTPTNSPIPTGTPTMTWTSGPTLGWIEATASAPVSGRIGHASVVFNNALWVIGGSNGSQLLNDGWYSTDGANWTEAVTLTHFIPRSFHSAVVYNNAIWVVGGAEGVLASAVNDVYRSTDGSNYVQMTASAPMSARCSHTSVVFNNAMWVAGGLGTTSGVLNNVNLGDVWNSTDGISWNQSTSNAAFGGRFGHAMVVYNNAMWIIAGQSLNGAGLFPPTVYSDVWTSTDGANWTLVTSNASFGPRAYLTAVVYNNAMWVLGGTSTGSVTSGALNDVWMSTDGAAWTQVASVAPFPARIGHSSVVYNGSIWAMLGKSNGGFLSDVWHGP